MKKNKVTNLLMRSMFEDLRQLDASFDFRKEEKIIRQINNERKKKNKIKLSKKDFYIF